MISRAARLADSLSKVVAPFELDESMRFYCPQENVDALSHPRVREFHEFLLHDYAPELPPGTHVLLLLPCTKTKPYPFSAEHRRINSALLAAGFDPIVDNSAPAALKAALPPEEDPRVLNASPLVGSDLVLHRMVVSEPMALVPYEFVYSWRGRQSPAASYDDPGLFEDRGTSVCPWRPDSTATLAGARRWRWGDAERAAYVTAHNRMAELIAATLSRFAHLYQRRLAWVSPGLTHKSFLLAASERSREGIPSHRIANRARLRLLSANDLVPGLVDVHPTHEETRAALLKLALRLARARGRRLSARAVMAHYARGGGSATPLALPELLETLLSLIRKSDKAAVAVP